ncbi:MAG TPA: cupin domain-containing protein [Candidatus Paceibacterota bacterium]|jgi:mannose-6-phosphate isomerase-like protein (cupin superfamily)|nr:cupin domain-containing protein [Candidatus Paceibacterota bacterium]
MKKSQFVFSLIVVIILLLVVGAGVHYYDKSKGVAYSVAQIDSKANMPYLANIVEQTQANTDFRKVLFTGTRSQLVIMSIPPGGEVGDETHTYTEQTLFFLSGTGKAVLDGKISPIGPGDVVVVVPGTEHNFINTGAVPLKIYTVYAPPNHIDGTTEATKAEADANVQDEAYGNQPK